MDSCAITGIQRAMRWLLERGSNGKEVSSSFLESGRNLLEGLASASNCKYDIPFRNFKAEEIICATSNFKETVMFDGTGDIFHGCFQHRLILVKRNRIFGDFQRFLPSTSRDIVISLMMSRHKNVMRFLGCCLDFKAPVLVYEYMGKDRLLHDILDSRKGPTSWKYNESLPWKIRLKIGTDVANAIVYLHTAFSTPVIHRDLSRLLRKCNQCVMKKHVEEKMHRTEIFNILV